MGAGAESWRVLWPEHPRALEGAPPSSSVPLSPAGCPQSQGLGGAFHCAKIFLSIYHFFCCFIFSFLSFPSFIIIFLLNLNAIRPRLHAKESG